MSNDNFQISGPNNWNIIEDLYNSALELEGAAREEFLTQACGNNESLLAEIRSLLSSAAAFDSFLDEPALEPGLAVLGLPDEDLSGRYIDRYKLVKLLGRGGMGEVYLAYDSRLNRQIALKLLPSDIAADPGRIRRFKLEARAASAISHPNVAHIYEIGRSHGRYYITMEYVAGKSLRQVLLEGTLETHQAIDIALQVATALATAHRRGIVHRDIKPENLMLSDDGYVKVLDFGLAKLSGSFGKGLLEEGADRKLSSLPGDTAPGIVAGTLAYMSPEQADGSEVDQRSDLWSLGVVLYEAISGTNPFAGKSFIELMAVLGRADLPPLTGLLQEPIPGLDEIVAKLICRNPEGRYQNSELLAADLRSLGQQIEGFPKRDLRLQTRRPGSTSGSKELTSSRWTERIRPAFDNLSFRNIKSGAETVAREVKQRKVGVSLILLVLVAAVFGLILPNYSAARAPAFTSIAVLPMINETGDPKADPISDGLSEGLIERLSNVQPLRIIARDSSFRYKGTKSDLADVARDLGVEALVAGSVTQSGDQLLVRIELIRGNDKAELWNRQYQYKMGDLPLISRDISTEIAAKLNVSLSSEESKLMANGSDADASAYQLYLQGRFYSNQLTKEALQKSIDCYNEAINNDPKFALAYAGLATSYVTLGANYLPPQEAYTKASHFAEKALELDQKRPEAHYAKAIVKYVYEWDLPGSEKELKLALDINHNYASAYSLLSSISLTRGNANRAVSQLKQALALDPLSLSHNVNLSSAYYFGRQSNLAVDQLKKTLNMAPDAPFIYDALGRVYLQMGRYDEALTACQRATILGGDDPGAYSSLGLVYASSGRENEARWVARTLEQLSGRKYVSPYYIAAIYGTLGDKEQAFVWLQKASAEHSALLLIINLDPSFDKLRSDSRYTALVKPIQLG